MERQHPEPSRGFPSSRGRCLEGTPVFLEASGFVFYHRAEGGECAFCQDKREISVVPVSRSTGPIQGRL